MLRSILPLALALLALPAGAQTPAVPLVVNGTTVGAPTAQLPLFGSTPGSCSVAPTAEPYDATQFVVDTDDTYDVTVTEPINDPAFPGTDDTILLVYETAFDPSNGCTNFVGVGNNPAGTPLAVTLDDATDYVLVVGGFFGTEDAYTVQIEGPAGSTVSEIGVAFDQDPINAATAGAVSFAISAIASGESYTYEITSDGGAGSVTSSGTASGTPEQVTGVDVSGLPDGTLTLSVSVAGGPALTDTAGKDTTVPSGYAVSIDLLGESNINGVNETAIEFQGTGLEVGATLNYSFTSNNGGTPVTGTETVTSASETFDNGGAGYDLSGLTDGTVMLSITLTDAASNTGATATDSESKDANAPSGYTVAWDVATIDRSNRAAAPLTITDAEIGTAVSGVVTSSGDGNTATVSFSLAEVTQNTQSLTVDVSSLTDGTLTVQLRLIDDGGNLGNIVSDNSATKDTSAPLATVTGVDLLVDTTADDQPYDATASLADCTDGLLDGDCTLREAIQVANANDGSGVTSDLDAIGFEIIAGNGLDGDGIATVVLDPALPSLTNDGTTLDGYTQPGTQRNTLATGSDAVLAIVIANGASIDDGLSLAGDDIHVSGLSILDFVDDAIQVDGERAVVEGSFLGVGPDGTTAGGNDYGVLVSSTGTGVRIGSDGDGTGDAGERNVISGNRVGLLVQGSGGSVRGNTIGTDASGTAALGNEVGAVLNTSASSIVSNVVSGNTGRAIVIDGDDNAVTDNLVGTDPTGLVAIGNGNDGVRVEPSERTSIVGNVIVQSGSDGIDLDNATDTIIEGNTIGAGIDGATLGAMHRVGIRVEEGSTVRIGTDADGTDDAAEANLITNSRFDAIRVDDAGTSATILGNRIFGNDELAIDLKSPVENGNDVTANDADDADDGPSGLQNYPVITAASLTPAGADVAFTLDSTPSTSFRVEFFSQAAADPSGFGEAETFLGSVAVATDADGDASGAFSAPGLPRGTFVTATATPITGSGPITYGGTSEVSAAVEVLPGVSFAEATVVGVEGASVEIVVSLSAPAVGGESVDVVLASSSPAGATSGDLSGFASETVTFGVGDTEGSVVIDVADDGRAEDVETFTLALQSLSGLALGTPAEAVITVDPSAVGVRFGVVQRVASESDEALTLRVLLSDVPPADAVIDVVLTEGDAIDLDGFTSERIQASSALGAPQVYTVTVPITDDGIVEGDERFVFELRLIDAGETDDGNAAVALTSPTATARILIDNDGALVTRTVPARDADGNGQEDGGPRAFALPVGGLTAGDVATVAGADSVYVVGPDGALVAVPTGAPLAAGAVVVADVAPGADLTFSGSEIPDPLAAGVVPAGEGERVLVAVGNPTDEIVPLRALDLEGADLSDVVLVFDAEAGSFRPVSLGGLDSDGVLGPFEVVIAQATPTGDASDVRATFDVSDTVADGVSLTNAPFAPTDGEAAVVVTFQSATAGASTSGTRPAASGDTFALRFGIGSDGLDPFDTFDVASPLGATAGALVVDAETDLPSVFAALAGLDLESGPVTVPLAVDVPQGGSYSFALDQALADLGPRPVLVEVLDGTASSALTPDAPVIITIGSSEDLTGRFALRVSLGNAVSTDDDALRPELSVWPNPSAGALAVSLTLPEAGDVRVAIYDALGREVARLHDGTASAGELRTDLPSGRLAPGSYLLRADGPGLSEVRSLTIVR